MSHLVNPLASAAQLARCRGRAAALGLPDDGADLLLDAVFFATQRLTQAAGLLLELPQSTTARAGVLLARYWVQAPGFEVEWGGGSAGSSSSAAGSPDYRHVSAAAVFLVAKTGPIPRSARDVANVYHFLGGGASNTVSDTVSDTASDTAYAAFHSHVLVCETRLLAALGFDTHVALPHPLAVTYLQALLPSVSSAASSSSGPNVLHPLARRAVAYLNTALLSPQLLYATHQPHELAVAAVYSAARDLAARLPDSAAGLPWWEVFDVDRETLGFLAVALRSVASWAADARQRLGSLGRDGGDPLLEDVGGVTKHRVAELARHMEEMG